MALLYSGVARSYDRNPARTAFEQQVGLAPFPIQVS